MKLRIWLFNFKYNGFYCSLNFSMWFTLAFKFFSASKKRNETSYIVAGYWLTSMTLGVCSFDVFFWGNSQLIPCCLLKFVLIFWVQTCLSPTSVCTLNLFQITGEVVLSWCPWFTRAHHSICSSPLKLIHLEIRPRSCQTDSSASLRSL